MGRHGMFETRAWAVEDKRDVCPDSGILQTPPIPPTRPPLLGNSCSLLRVQAEGSRAASFVLCRNASGSCSQVKPSEDPCLGDVQGLVQGHYSYRLRSQRQNTQAGRILRKSALTQHMHCHPSVPEAGQPVPFGDHASSTEPSLSPTILNRVVGQV